jgi:hypothetical protein
MPFIGKIRISENRHFLANERTPWFTGHDAS